MTWPAIFGATLTATVVNSPVSELSFCVSLAACPVEYEFDVYNKCLLPLPVLTPNPRPVFITIETKNYGKTFSNISDALWTADF